MTSHGPPSSNLPPSMGPGARPVQPGDPANRPGGLAEILKIRSKYTIAAESEILQLGYEFNGEPRLYRLPFESMPLGTFSRWLLYGGPKRARTAGSQVLDVIRRIEDLSHEPVTQREAEGITYHLSRASLYRLTGDLVACSLGGFIAYRNRDKMKFPFLSPKPLERYNSFPSPRLALVQGRYAQILWHITRANMWAGLFIIGLTPIFSSWGNFAAWRGIYVDDRTQRIIHTLTHPSQPLPDRAGAGNAQRQPRRQSQTESGYSGLDEQEYDGSKDDAAPTYDYSAGRQYTGGRAYPETAASNGLGADSDWRSQQSGQWSGGASYGTSSTSTQQTQSGVDDLFLDDDASPTAGNGSDMSTSAPYDPPRGSAWARLRSGNRPASAQRAGPSGAESGRPAEVTDVAGWKSRETTEELPGQTARSLSQREFDEMLERERRLSGSDEYDKGMRAVESGQDKATESGSGTSAWRR